MNLTPAAKFHLLGQTLAAVAQIVMPTIGPAFHVSDPMLHFGEALLACGQSVAGIWAVFITSHMNGSEK